MKRALSLLALLVMDQYALAQPNARYVIARRL
jgi:hypothetical protein